ncbi:MAG: DUF4349 domain-containing protein [Fluviicola sp.]
MKCIPIYLVSILFVFGCTPADSSYDVSPERGTVAREKKLKSNAEQRSKIAADASPHLASNARADVAYNSVGNVNNSPEAPQDNLVSDRKLIWNADLEFEVLNLERSFRAIRKMCKEHDGFISDMEHTNEAYESSMQLNVRVASENFHDLVASIKGQSKKLDVALISSDDVTEEFVDIETRLKTKRQARERYIEILRSKTGTIEEVIQAEEAIRRITEEIEAKEGRLRYLNDQVDFSTIDIRMYKKADQNQKDLAETPTYGDKAENSFTSGWEAIKSLGLFLITIWPLLFVLSIVAVWKRKWIREKVSLPRRKK